MEQQLTWDDFSKVYTAEDITANTIIVEVLSRGMACAPVAFSFWFVIPDLSVVPGFNEALAGLSETDGEEPFQDEITFLGSLSEFLAVSKHQEELREDYNLYHKDQLPDGFQFKLGDEALIAAALNAHNDLQF